VLALRVGTVLTLVRFQLLRLSERRRRRASLLLAWAVGGALPSIKSLRRVGGDPS
jgi:hypothetical protein